MAKLFRTAIVAGVLLFACHNCPSVAQHVEPVVRPTALSTTSPTVSPYILFATSFSIYRMNIDGSEKQLVVRERDGGIMAVDYHYRLGCIFWATSFPGSLAKIITAQMDGSNITVIADNGILYISGLAVDWINDKLYWIDRNQHRIEEYDLTTSQRRVVLTTGDLSLPVGLAVDPFQNPGRLYWTDRRKNTIETATAISKESTIVHTGLRCAGSLTLEYRPYTLYWVDNCVYRIEALDIKTLRHSIPVDSQMHLVRFTSGIAHFRDTLYWTEPTEIFSTKGEKVSMLLRLSSLDSLSGIQIIHPTRQLTVEQNSSGLPSMAVPVPTTTVIPDVTPSPSKDPYSVQVDSSISATSVEPGLFPVTALVSTPTHHQSARAALLSTQTHHESSPVVTPASTPVDHESPSVVTLVSTPAHHESSSVVTLVSTPAHHESSSVATLTLGQTPSLLETNLPSLAPTHQEPSSWSSVIPVIPPTDEGILRGGDTTTLLISVTVSAGIALITVVTVGYAVLLYVKYNRKKGSWSPRRYELAYAPHPPSSRSSFRVIREASPHEVPASPGHAVTPNICTSTAGSSETQSFEIEWNV